MVAYGARGWLNLSLLILAMVNISHAGAINRGTPVFRHLGVTEGLPDHHVEAMVQDERGFVWIATRHGLVRHEGANVRPVPIDIEGFGGSSNPNVVTLAASRTGSIWAAVANGGVVEIGPDLKVIRHLRPQSSQGRLPDSNVWSIVEDCQGQLWFAFMEGGLARYRPQSDDVLLVPQSGEFGLAESGFQMQLEVDRQCRLWLAQSDQLSVKDPGSGSNFSPVARRSKQQPLMTSVRATQDGALHLIQGNRLRQIENRGDHWSLQTVQETEGVIVDVEFDHSGFYNLSTYEGLVRWNPETGETLGIKTERGRLDGLPANELLHSMLDREGGLWLSVARSGIVYLSPDTWAFRRFQEQPGVGAGLPMRSVYAIQASDDPDRLWIAGRTEGLHLLDLITGLTTPASVLLGQTELESIERINRLSLMREDLVIAWSSQVDALNFDSLELRRVFDSQRLTNGSITVIESDQEDQLWLGTFGQGVYSYQPSRDLLEHFPPSQRGLRIPDGHGISAMAQDSNGSWWFAAGSRLFNYRANKKQFDNELELARGTIRALLFEEGNLYIATDEDVQRWLRRERSLEFVAALRFRDLVPGGRPFEIIRDGRGSHWLALTSGLLRFDIQQSQMEFIGSNERLAIGELHTHAITKLPSGELALGGSQGLALFDPARLRQRRVLNDVEIVRVSSQGHQLGFESDLVVGHQQRDLEIQFASPTYADRDQLRYRLRLKGAHENWHLVYGRNHQEYFNLSPGRYRFEVQVARPGGPWRLEGDALEITIKAPPWLHPLAYALYAVLILLASIWAYLIRARSNARKHKLLSARQDRLVAEKANAAKSDFLATMSHEMRTPLHGVLGVLELLHREVDEPKAQDMLVTVEKTGRQLKRIVDDVLDLSKIEADQLDLYQVPFEFVSAIEQGVELFAPLASAAGLDLRLRINSDTPAMALGDRERLIQIIGNLLSNAIKFTPSGGVEVAVRQGQAGELKIRVSDSGPGICKDDREKLFTRYQQLGHNAASSLKGTGLGLAITSKLVQAMGGEIKLSQTRLAGACFELTLPDLFLNNEQGSRARLIQPAWLKGLSLDSDISPSDRRSVHRLARRWGFNHYKSINAVHRRTSRLILIDPRVRMPAEQTDYYECFLYIHPPHVQIPDAWQQDSRFSSLGWPLTERRLLNSLLRCSVFRADSTKPDPRPESNKSSEDSCKRLHS